MTFGYIWLDTCYKGRANVEIRDLDTMVQELTDERPTPCQFLTGAAGTGKTYEIIRRIGNDSSYGILAATTGIASVNLGATTLNSLLRFFDTASMRDSYLNGSLVRILHELAKQYAWLIVDEVSMMDAEQLDILVRATTEANRYADVKEPMGILLVGDFAQLPPVRARWAFEANVWPRFELGTERLTKMWRQTDEGFLAALNAVRAGYGSTGAAILTGLGAEWHTQLDTEYEGTTILPKNDQVGRYNALALDRLPGNKIIVSSRRWGQQRSEWGENRRTHEWGIPPKLELKVGAYVMLLANKSDGDGGFEYVNGDCGHIIGYHPADGGGFDVELVRNDSVVHVVPIVREVSLADKPSDFGGRWVPSSEDTGQYIEEPHWRVKARRFVTGQIQYFPLRLAYATTVHKSQSLTLDRVQLDFRGHFMSSPGMLYVALSRCRALTGLRLVGQSDVFVKRCQVDSRIARWL